MSPNAHRVPASMLASVVNASADPIYSSDLNGLVTSWNPAAEAAYGLTAEEMIGTPNVRIVPEDLREEASSRRIAVRERGEVQRWETERMTSAGERFPVEVTWSPIRGEDDEIVGIATIAHDLRGRRHAERQLAESVQRLQAVVNTAPMVLWAIDTDEVFTLSEGKGLEAMGLRPGQVVGSTVREVYGDDAELMADHDRVMAGHTFVSTIEVAGRHLESFHAPTRDADGRIVGHMGVAHDVTDRLRMEREYRELLERLAQAERLESVGQLAGGIAHDFNNLIAVILNYASFALEDLPPGSSSREDVEEIRRAAERAGRLTRQLLTFSRRGVVQLETLDPAAAAQDVARMLRRTLGTEVELVVRTQGTRPIDADRGNVEQLLVNLAINARDAMPAGGTVTVSVADVRLADDEVPELVAGDYVRIAVSDTGTGMTPEVAARALDPFFTTKPRGAGTGLGLATVYGIAKQAAGEIVIDSAEGSGTTVAVYWPAAAATATAVAGTVAAPAPADPAPAATTVLVAEDEPGVRELTRRILDRAGHRVLIAGDGESALAVARGHDGPIDLLVADVLMPGMSGPELGRRLQAARPETPVLFVSGYAEDHLADRGVLHPGVSLLSKPFDAEALLGRVRELL